jgi:hypothetical protein
MERAEAVASNLFCFLKTGNDKPILECLAGHLTRLELYFQATALADTTSFHHNLPL